MSQRALALAPGAGVTEWHCAEGSASRPPGAPDTDTCTCTGWSATAAWKAVGCKTGAVVAGGDMASDCVAIFEVLNATKSRASHNVLLFLPPKSMELAPASVSAVVGSGPEGQPQITLTAPGTANATL